MLLRVLNQSGDVFGAKSLSESMLARGNDLSDDMRAQVERIYAESVCERLTSGVRILLSSTTLAVRCLGEPASEAPDAHQRRELCSPRESVSQVQ